MAAPNYPRNGNQRIRRITVNKQMAATICDASGRNRLRTSADSLNCF